MNIALCGCRWEGRFDYPADACPVLPPVDVRTGRQSTRHLTSLRKRAGWTGPGATTAPVEPDPRDERDDHDPDAHDREGNR
jgi:hypothetical protein